MCIKTVSVLAVVMLSAGVTSDDGNALLQETIKKYRDLKSICYKAVTNVKDPLGGIKGERIVIIEGKDKILVKAKEELTRPAGVFKNEDVIFLKAGKAIMYQYKSADKESSYSEEKPEPEGDIQTGDVVAQFYLGGDFVDLLPIEAVPEMMNWKKDGEKLVGISKYSGEKGGKTIKLEYRLIFTLDKNGWIVKWATEVDHDDSKDVTGRLK